MFKKNIINIFILIFAGLVCILYLRSYIDAVKGDFNDYIVKCSDFGQYYAEVNKYTQSGVYLKNIVDSGKEPGYLIESANISNILNINSKTSMIVLDFIIHLTTIVSIYLLTLRLTANKITGLIILLVSTSSYLFNIEYIFLFSRQEYANLSLLLICLSSTYIKRNVWWLSGIFLGMSIVGHRISMLLSICSFSLVICSYVYLKEWREVKRNIKIVFLGLLISAPYFAIQTWALLDTIQWYLNNTLLSDGVTTASNAAKSSGWDFLTFSGSIPNLPIIHYFYYLPIFSIVCLIGTLRSGKTLFKKTRFAFMLLAILVCYTSTRLFFSMRFILTLNILFFVCISGFFSIHTSKILRITTVFGLIILGLFGVNNRLNIKQIRTIKFDSSMEYLKNYPNKNIFWVGSGCTQDIGTQLGFLSAFTVPHNLLDSDSKNDELGYLNMYVGSDVAITLGKSIIEKPYLYKYYKDKTIWLVYGSDFDKEDINKLVLGKHDIQNKPYLNLVYRSADPKSYIRYIYEIDNTKINYFDAVNYLEQNLK